MKKISILLFVAILSITTFAAEATEESADTQPQSVSKMVESAKTFIAENGIQFLINLVTAAAIFFIGKWVVKTIAGLLKKAMDKANVDP
ncbi:MAG: membrane protein, partial [Planctomycetota bacterium]